MLKSFAELCLATFKKDQLSSSESELYRHSHDESHHAEVEPDYVFFPESTEDVRKMIEIATQSEIPMTAFGAGSGLEGQAIPFLKDVSINFERMNKVLEFSPEDMLITVLPGITRLELNSFVN